MSKSIHYDSRNIIDHGDHNMELLLCLLLPNINAPIIEVSNEKVDIGITHGAAAERKITIRNIGRGVLSGKIEMARPVAGIELSVGSFSINSKNKDEVTFTILINQNRNMRAATYRNEIIITSNASENQVVIPLRLNIGEPLKQKMFRLLDYNDKLLLEHIEIAIGLSAIFFFYAIFAFIFSGIATAIKETIVDKTFFTEPTLILLIAVISVVSPFIAFIFWTDMSLNIEFRGSAIREYTFMINPVIGLSSLILCAFSHIVFLPPYLFFDMDFANLITTMVWFADLHYVWSVLIVSIALAIIIYLFSFLMHQLLRLTFWDTVAFKKHSNATGAVLMHGGVFLAIYAISFSVNKTMLDIIGEIVNSNLISEDSLTVILRIFSIATLCLYVGITILSNYRSELSRYENPSAIIAILGLIIGSSTTPYIYSYAFIRSTFIIWIITLLVVNICLYLFGKGNKYSQMLSIARSAVQNIVTTFDQKREANAQYGEQTNDSKSNINKIYYIVDQDLYDERSGNISLADLEIGSRVVDPTWAWEFRTGENYTGYGEKKPLVWIVVAKNHYGEGSGITLLAEELIGLHVFDDSERRIETGGLQGVLSSSNHWGVSGTLNASHGLRPWLNSTGIHSREGFYTKLSKSFKNNIMTLAVPNANTSGNNYVTADNIFIPSMTEMGDEINRDTYQIGSVYPYFKNKPKDLRIACLDDKARSYWTRSPYSRYVKEVRCVDSDGGFAWELDANHTKIGVRPALNINPKIILLG